MLAALTASTAYKLWLTGSPSYRHHDAVVTRDGSLVIYRPFLWPLVFKRCEAVFRDDVPVPVDVYLAREGVWRTYRCTFTPLEDNKAIISYVTGEKNNRTRIIFGN